MFSLLVGSALLHQASSQIIGGQGQFRFEYVPEKLVMPAGTSVGDSHGWAVDADNNIYLTYNPAAGDTNCLVRWAPDGTQGQVFGPGASVCAGTPHGLRLHKEGSNTYLYHANNGQSLVKTTLDGTIVWAKHGPPSNDTKYAHYAPTWFATPPGNFVYMADGYGSNYIHQYTLDGEYTGRSFGGPGTAPGLFQTCHAINYDPRVDKLVVSDRENHRHQFFDFDADKGDVFQYNSSFTVPELQRPCTIRFDYGNGFAIVPALEGPVGILDKDNKVVSVIDVAGLLGSLGHVHPHDATFLPNGDIVVCTWNPGRVSYWRRLPSSDIIV